MFLQLTNLDKIKSKIKLFEKTKQVFICFMWGRLKISYYQDQEVSNCY
jgi:hypothetical protein